MNASIAVAFDSSPASSGRQPGMRATISLTVRTAASSSPQISTSESIGSPRWPSSLAGRWWNAATTWQRGTAACTWAATEPRGGTSGWNSWPTRTSALAMLMTTLPASTSAFSCAVVAAESHGVAITTRSQSQASALSPLPSRLARSGHLTSRPSRASIARYFEREPMTTS